uniref:Uncharacterized protein n=1 Tax=Meloidogyne hapla TaxID=6305 RepID=A0A1I8BKD2_MELHA
MKQQKFVSFLLLLGAFSGTFLCVVIGQEENNDVMDSIWLIAPNQNLQIEQNQDEEKPNKKEDDNKKTDNTMDTSTIPSIDGNSNSITSIKTTITNLTKQQKATSIKTIPTSKTEEKTTNVKKETAPSTIPDTITDLPTESSLPDEETTMEPMTKIIIIGGIVVGIIVLFIILWLCSNFGLFSWICSQFSKLTKKRVKQQQFDDIDYDPKYTFFKPRNFKGKGAIIIQKQMKFPDNPTPNEKLPEDLNDIKITYTRKLCAVYEVGSEIECVVDEFERPVKGTKHMKQKLKGVIMKVILMIRQHLQT